MDLHPRISDHHGHVYIFVNTYYGYQAGKTQKFHHVKHLQNHLRKCMSSVYTLPLRFPKTKISLHCCISGWTKNSGRVTILPVLQYRWTTVAGIWVPRMLPGPQFRCCGYWFHSQPQSSWHQLMMCLLIGDGSWKTPVKQVLLLLQLWFPISE